MAKFSGVVGYSEDNVKLAPGVFGHRMVERPCRGDVVMSIRSLDEGESTNHDISVSNSLSIVADAYALMHFFAIRYVKWQGVLWTVQTVEVQGPRLLLRLGEVWNGATPSNSQ